MLPWYDYYIIWQGLYTVHGGSIDWTSDGHGIVSFSNELWNGSQYFQSPLLTEQQQDDRTPISRGLSRYFFDEFLEFGEHYLEWTPFNHPEYGEVEMSGTGKLTSRINPRFMSMELFHRNMAFTLYHADEMPIMKMGETKVESLGGGHVQGLGGHHERARHPQHHRSGHEQPGRAAGPSHRRQGTWRSSRRDGWRTNTNPGKPNSSTRRI